MLKTLLFTVSALIFFNGLQAQDKFYTKTGKIEFSSKAPMEDIEAKNKTLAGLLDTKTGMLQFSVLMKGFEFPKALMQEHFNENYVESDKYPRGDFKGTITNNKDINYSVDGTYPAEVTGKLTLHGVTRDLKTKGSVKVENGKIETNATFNVLLSDYQIKIPSVVKEKLSNNIKVVVECKMDPLK
jgi:hypothetical protein